MSSKGLKFSNSTQIDPYKQHCSLMTLQSDPNGNFSKLMDHLRKVTGNYVNVLLQISELEKPYDIVKFAAYIEGMAIFLPKPFYARKNNDEAQESREKGNEFFKKGDFKKAFFHYTIAVMKAEYPKENNSSQQEQKDTTTLLAFALGNRSAASFHLKNYQESISDIHFALSLNYPKASRLKLYERLGRCHLAMKEKIKAKTAFNICRQLTTDQKIIKTIDSLLKEANEDSNSSTPPSSKKESSILFDDLLNKHEEHPEFSAKISIESNEMVGRHAITKEDIEPFETVLVEEPFAHVLNIDKSGYNCLHCLERLKTAIPCKNCSGVAYCSVFCRDEAQQSYHQWECEYQDVLTGFGCSSVSRLALRMITSKPLNFFLERKNDITNNTTEKEDESGDTYLQILSLVSLQKQRWPEDTLVRSCMALVLLGILRSTGYFGAKKINSSGPNSYTNNELYIGSLIFCHLQILQFNAHEIHEVWRVSKQSLTPYKNVPIAVAIYPSAAFINHNCHGNVARCFQGSRMVLKALRLIKSGHEVCDNYGPTFYKKTRNERRKELKARYWFDCQCPACCHNWPTLNGLVKSTDELNLESVDEFMKQGDIPSATEALIPLLHDFINDVNMSEQLIRAEDKLRTCINSHGNIVFGTLTK